MIQEVVHLEINNKIKLGIFFFLSPLFFPNWSCTSRYDLPLGDKYVVSETFTGTTRMTWCLAYLIRILIGVCRRGFYKW